MIPFAAQGLEVDVVADVVDVEAAEDVAALAPHRSRTQTPIRTAF